jgi:cell division protein FtsZ
MLFEVNEKVESPAVLKVIGLGGAGGNAVNRMISSEIRGVDFLIANTDIQALNSSECPERIQIGASITGGLGSGGDPEIGRKSAEEDREQIRAHLEGADMVFITAGMGGGTGTGASAIVAEVAREINALTVGIVTKPFTFEGRKRMRHAEEGLEQLRRSVDTLIVIPNQRLLHVVDRNTPLNEALSVADDVLAHATKGISEIITVPGLVNVDFADVRSVMRGMGNALMGMGFAQGPDRAREAAQMAISSPLLEDISIAGARALLVNFQGGDDMSLAEIDEASNAILEAAGEEALVIFGAVVDSSLKDEMRVTLIATGFGVEQHENPQRSGIIEADRTATPEVQAVTVNPLTASPATSSSHGATRPLTAVNTPTSGFDHTDALDSGVVGTPQPIRNREPLRTAPITNQPKPQTSAGGYDPEAERPGLDDFERKQQLAKPAYQRSGKMAFGGQSGPARDRQQRETPPEPLTSRRPEERDRSGFESDGIVGPARPISTGAKPARIVRPETPVNSNTTLASTMKETPGSVDTYGSVVNHSSSAPDNVVPLVWKQGQPNRQWEPQTRTSRWQRVLRRDRLDVPSFLRRRQMD